MRLSVLDQSPVPKGADAAQAVANTISLAKAAEKLGYHRYWVAEHHNTSSFARSAPEVRLLGSGVHSAVYAAEFGLPFSHAHFISAEGSLEAAQAYHERFKPSGWCERPRLSIGV